jgi:hypothetical protein
MYPCEGAIDKIDRAAASTTKKEQLAVLELRDRGAITTGTEMLPVGAFHNGV